MGEIAVRAVTLPLAPWAILQGRRVRAGMPPVCAAAGEPRGTVRVPRADRLRLLVVGESTVGHLFAVDGFHPSSAGDAVWAAALAAAGAPLVSS
jgi:lysophospholipase L1-like esterase